MSLATLKSAPAPDTAPFVPLEVQWVLHLSAPVHTGIGNIAMPSHAWQKGCACIPAQSTGMISDAWAQG